MFIIQATELLSMYWALQESKNYVEMEAASLVLVFAHTCRYFFKRKLFLTKITFFVGCLYKLFTVILKVGVPYCERDHYV